MEKVILKIGATMSNKIDAFNNDKIKCKKCKEYYEYCDHYGSLRFRKSVKNTLCPNCYKIFYVKYSPFRHPMIYRKPGIFPTAMEDFLNEK